MNFESKPAAETRTKVTALAAPPFVPGAKRSYVTSFPGRRDSYQVPLALAEQGRLAAFATCFYRNRGLIGRLLPRAAPLQSRHAEGLPPERVKTMEMTHLAARLAAKFLQPSRVGVWEDLAFARHAVELARKYRASLFLYEFQADWAFRQSFQHEPVRILFQFHPHPVLEHPLLEADGSRYPQFMDGIRRNTRANLPRSYREHTRSAWKLADHVIVASRFTADSLEMAGCPASRISVVPYGCSARALVVKDQVTRRPADGRPYFLYVGSGTHRKGLHHLLEAWSRTPLQSSHDLVVIARAVDPELREPLAQARSVRLLRGVTSAELSGYYASAQAFVLPSLSEGFGHVYLEALANGAPVIGTRNSMLPDFVAGQTHIRYVEPGNPDDLQRQLEEVAALPLNAPFFQTEAVRKDIQDQTWTQFRGGIESVLARFDR
jgi:glycosyltransferase involved in cell wall biosynthesis